MACDLTLGRKEPCKDVVGGIKNVYFTDFGDFGTVTLTDDEITDMSGTFTAFKYEVKGNSSLEQTVNASRENGTVFYEQTVNAVFFKLQSSTRNQVKVLAQNPDLKMIVETNNGSVDGVGRYWLLGEDRGMQLLSGTGATGTAFGDLNGYTLTFTGQEPNPASEISGSLSGSLSGITLG